MASERSLGGQPPRFARVVFGAEAQGDHGGHVRILWEHGAEVLPQQGQDTVHLHGHVLAVVNRQKRNLETSAGSLSVSISDPCQESTYVNRLTITFAPIMHELSKKSCRIKMSQMLSLTMVI